MRGKFFTLRLTEEERTELEQKSSAAQMTAGGFIRWLIKRFKIKKENAVGEHAILQLDQMTTAEKIRAMESLWNDLCKHVYAVASPSWHKDILSQREKSVAKGKEKFNDCDHRVK